MERRVGFRGACGSPRGACARRVGAGPTALRSIATKEGERASLFNARWKAIIALQTSHAHAPLNRIHDERPHRPSARCSRKPCMPLAAGPAAPTAPAVIADLQGRGRARRRFSCACRWLAWKWYDMDGGQYRVGRVCESIEPCGGSQLAAAGRMIGFTCKTRACETMLACEMGDQSQHLS